MVLRKRYKIWTGQRKKANILRFDLPGKGNFEGSQASMHFNGCWGRQGTTRNTILSFNASLFRCTPVNEFYRRTRMGVAGHCSDKRIDTDE